MKNISRFLLIAISLVSAANAAPVATTAGSNLTAYNPSSMGSNNNNAWNGLMNNRTAPATADFGNCNALILRCAQPKCASGGCTSMDVATPIVAGCVQSNDACKQYGNDLVQYISAQLVATSTARANEQAAAAEIAAAQNAAAQSAQQMQQMQAQMQSQLQQMQAQMEQQNAATVNQLQQALEEQKQLTAAAQQSATTAAATANTATVATPSGANTITVNQDVAARSGVSAEVLAREQLSGQVMSKIENAETQLKKLKVTMDQIFDYAHCDRFGNNCAGPKRVATFKRHVNEFFDPYNAVLDEVYDAILYAQTAGVDITDVYMLLNGSCNQWGEYMCSGGEKTGQDRNGVWIYKWPRYNSTDKSQEINCINNSSHQSGTTRGGHECYHNQVVPPEDDPNCVLVNMIKSSDTDGVKRNFLFTQEGDYGDNIRVGCASSALENSRLFRNNRKSRQSSIDIEVLQRIVAQDAPKTVARNSALKENENLKYCALTESTLTDLQKYVTLKTLPTRGICIDERTLNRNRDRIYLAQESSVIDIARAACENRGNGVFSAVTFNCYCKDGENKDASANCNSTNSAAAKVAAEKKLCEYYKATWNNKSETETCDCNSAKYEEDKAYCATKFDQDVYSSSNSGSAASAGGGNPMADANACIGAGGEYSYAEGKCKCGSTVMYPSIHNCIGGSVFNKSISTSGNKLNLSVPSISDMLKK